MKTMSYSGPMEVVCVSLETDEQLLESIRAAIAAHDIQNGVIVSGIATLKRCQMHYVEHTDFPPEDTFFTVEKPLEVGAVSGIIADGEPHVHIVFGCRDTQTWVGHLEDDSAVAYLCELCILKFNGLRMARHGHEAHGVKRLGPEVGEPAGEALTAAAGPGRAVRSRPPSARDRSG